MAVHADHIGRLLRRSSAVRPSLLVYGLCLLGVAALWPTFSSLGRLWQQSYDYSHGYLIAAVSIIWLLLSRRHLDSAAVRPMPAALPPLLLVIGIWAIAYRANSEIIQQLVTPAILLLAVLAASGRQLTARVIAPVAYLYFVIPIWDQLLPWLQMLTTMVAEGVLRLVDVPAVVDGHTVTIPEGRFTIVEGCSGKRYLLVALAFAALVAATQGLRRGRTVFLIAVAAVLALITNWIRVVVIIYAGHVSNMENYLVAEEHISFGWAMFVPLLLAVIFMARRLGRDVTHRHQPAGAPASDAAAPGAAWLLPIACLCIPVLLVTAPPDEARTAPRLGQLPVRVGAWQGPLPPDRLWQPQFTSPTDELRAAYTSPEGEVQLYMNVYGVQSQGHELVFFSNSVAPPERWKILQQLPRHDGLATFIAADSADDRWVIAQTWSVRGRLTAVPALAQLYYGMHAVWRAVPSGTIALAAPCRPDCSQAAARIDRFWRDNGRAMTNLIPENL